MLKTGHSLQIEILLGHCLKLLRLFAHLKTIFLRAIKYLCIIKDYFLKHSHNLSEIEEVEAFSLEDLNDVFVHRTVS